MLPQFCRWHFLFISIIKGLNHNKETFAISLHIICKHHEILLECQGLEIWMASVHYHDWSSDKWSNDYSNLSLHSWNGKACSHVASRCRDTTVFPQLRFLTGAAFLVNGLVRWSKTVSPHLQISASRLLSLGAHRFSIPARSGSKKCSVRFEFSTVVLLLTEAIWDITLCCWVSILQEYEGTKCLHLQGLRGSMTISFSVQDMRFSWWWLQILSFSEMWWFAVR
jgi:hypothetical protein